MNAVEVLASGTNAQIARLFEGTETVVVPDGRFDEPAVRHEGLRRADLDAALKRQGANDVSEVARAALGTGGAVVVDLKPEAAPATKADVAAIAAALRRLEERLPSPG